MIRNTEPVHAMKAERCVICGEPCDGRGGGTAEMHDPENPEEHGGVVHADCGLGRGWDVS